MVVGLVAQDGVGAVELLGGEGPDHLVRKGHGAEAPLAVGAVADGVVEAVRAADDEGEVFEAPDLEVFEVLGKGHRGEGLAAFVEEDEVVHAGAVEVAGEGFAFFRPDPSGVGLPRAGFDVRDFNELKAGVPVESFDVFVGAGADPGGLGFAYSDEGNLHVTKVRPRLQGMAYLRSMWTNQMLALIDLALDEDLGRGDHTTASSVPEGLQREGVIRAKEAGRVAGVEVAVKVFEVVDAALECTVLKADGEAVVPGDEVMRIRGAARSILMGERLALNFMQRMSGIATRTASVVAQLEGTGCRVLDTRKTTPGLRAFEKWAVRIGGGVNHRMALDDMILIKDHHVDYAGSMTAALEGVHRYLVERGLEVPVVVEVRDAAEADEALAASERLRRGSGEPLVERLLLDNHSPAEAADQVRRLQGRIALEASGGITPDNARAYAEAGVDFVSMGWLTHSVPSLDLSLKSVDLA